MFTNCLIYCFVVLHECAIGDKIVLHNSSYPVIFRNKNVFVNMFIYIDNTACVYGCIKYAYAILPVQCYTASLNKQRCSGMRQKVDNEMF